MGPAAFVGKQNLRKSVDGMCKHGCSDALYPVLGFCVWAPYTVAFTTTTNPPQDSNFVYSTSTPASALNTTNSRRCLLHVWRRLFTLIYLFSFVSFFNFCICCILETHQPPPPTYLRWIQQEIWHHHLWTVCRLLFFFFKEARQRKSAEPSEALTLTFVFTHTPPPFRVQCVSGSSSNEKCSPAAFFSPKAFVSCHGWLMRLIPKCMFVEWLKGMLHPLIIPVLTLCYRNSKTLKKTTFSTWRRSFSHTRSQSTRHTFK